MSVLDRIASLTPEQRALFELLREKKRKAAAQLRQPPPIARRSGPTGEGDWPLSFDQERLWFLHQLDPTSTAYNIDLGTRFTGDLRLPVLQRALAEIVRRHAAWRTTFPLVDGLPVQRVAPSLHLPLHEVDLSALPEEERRRSAYRVQWLEGRRAFDLERGPLVRATLLRLAPREHVCLLTVHHTATDWVSFQLFWMELAVLYEALLAGRPSPLPEPPVQYSDFSIWQREWLRGEVLERYVDYWLQALDGVPHFLDLPTDRPRPAASTLRGGRHQVWIGRETTEGLRELARREGVTLFMALLAVCQALLARYTGQERLIVGSPNANRNRPEIEPLLGFFITQLVFATDLSGDPTFHDLVARVRATCLGAFAHQELPFGKLVEALQPERDVTRPPLIQVVLLVLDGKYTKRQLPSLTAEPVDVYDGNARYDLMWGLYERADCIEGPFEYNAEVLDATTAARFLELFYRAIEAVIADPEVRLSELPAFTEAGRQQVLVEWNDTARPLPAPGIGRLLAERAAAAPDGVAVVAAEETLSAGELARRAGALARRLRRAGAGPGERVAVCLERGAGMIVALLGAMEAGASYLPLDPTYPPERLAFILEDAAAAVVVTDEPPAAALPESGALRLALDSGEGGEETCRAPRREEPSPGDRAYVIYTSGSTGRPKGVEVTHGALGNFLAAMSELHRLGAEDSWLALTTISFDMSLLELLLPLASGARLVVESRETAGDGSLVARALAEHRATFLQATPAAWRQLVDSGWGGSPGLSMIAGGEALAPDLAAGLLAAGRRLWNHYGPTETTVWSTVERLHGEAGPVPLGRPIANTRLYLFDRFQAPVPHGAVGELVIAGAGVARGYLGRPALTAERFLPDPFAGEPGARLYRTGDLARLRASGRVDYLGRVDHQVKVRGFRIELGEIETALRRHPAVADAVVLVREDRPGDRRLTAYLVPGEAAPPESAELRSFLRQSLPEYMVPALFVLLAELPLGPSGKVDRRALMRLRPEEEAAPGDREAPRTPTEELLVGLWADVLGIPEGGRVGRDDDFFALGGHSLLVTRLVMRLRAACGVELPVAAVFQAPTPAELAAAVDRRLAAGEAASHPLAAIERASRDAPLPLSFAQERLWFLDQLAPGSPVYNQPLALAAQGRLDLAALERTLSALIERHETLRTAFVAVDGLPVARIAAPSPLRMPVVDLERLSEGQREAEARRLALAEAAAPFDLAAGQPMRAAVLRLTGDRAVVLLNLHHIVTDAWSMGVLVRETAALYTALAAGREPLLPPLPVQYADFAVWQRGWLAGAELERQLAYWRQRMAGAPAELELPTDRPRPPLATLHGATVPVRLPPETAGAVQRLARQRGATPFMALAAALAALLGRWSGQEDVVVGTAHANRDRAEVEGLIGFFVNTLPLRSDLGGDPSFATLLARVRQAALDAYAHRDLPFEKLVEELQPRRSMSRQPIFQVMLTLQNVPFEAVELPGLVLAPLASDTATAKFDLALTLMEEEGGIAGGLEYAADLFDRTTALRFAAAFRRLLAAAAADAETRIGDLPLLGAGERHQVEVGWNDTAAPLPRGATVHGLVERQAAATPDAVALSGAEESLSYAELVRRARRLGRHLERRGVGPEVTVALCLERSLDLVVALLAVLEAGGAYCPLDPAYPPARLAFLLADSGARVLVTREELLAAAPETFAAAAIEAVRLDRDAAAIAAESDAPLAPPPAAGLAYLIYTSGSTGTPKGVAVTHRNVVRLLRGQRFARFAPDETVLQAAPVSFDASTLELWAPLSHGGRLVLLPPGPLALEDLGAALARHRVTFLWLTAGLFHQMVEGHLASLAPLRQLMFGGDVVSPALARRLAEALPGRRFTNGYGPTEGTTFTACHEVSAAPRAAAASLPIGRPIGNTRVLVLDDLLRPAPIGVAGELFLGGDGMARGYHRRRALSAERFVPDPWSDGGRLYRTGDSVRWLPEGRLELLGRRDQQIKVRGFRVEPGEVEAALAAHPGVGEVVVTAPRDASGDRRLAAYFVPAVSGPGGPGTSDEPDEPGEPAGKAPEAAELREFLAGRLPGHMIPSFFVPLAALPLTANGKVDRGALPAAEGSVAGTGYVAPRDAVEELVAELAAGVLRLERVGAQDDFFQLGGHSLLATQLLSRLRTAFRVELPLAVLFEAPTPAGIAAAIRSREAVAGQAEKIAGVVLRLKRMSPEAKAEARRRRQAGEG